MAAAEEAEAHSRILAAVSACPIIDHHCHNICDSTDLDIETCFTEASGGALRDASTALAVQRGVRDVAGLLGCASTAEGVQARRRELGVAGVARLCFQASNIKGLLVDDGIRKEGLLPLSAHRDFVPYVGRVLRLETVAEDILSSAPTWTLDNFEAALRRQIDPPPPGVVSFKSAAAYRSGLEIDPRAPRADAEAALAATLLAARSGTAGEPGRVRLTVRAIIDFVFTVGLEVATARRLPVQVHTGFGDTDLDLRKSSALHLRAVLEDPRFAESKIVLLHAAYPYTREAGFLASSYQQVYLDFGLAVPLLSAQGMRSAVRECLHLTPTSKLLFSTDAHFFPEGYYVGVLRGRQVLAAELCRAVDDGDLTAEGAVAAAHAVLHNNALRIYGLPGTIDPVGSLQPPAAAPAAAPAAGGGGAQPPATTRSPAGPGWGAPPVPPRGVAGPPPAGVRFVQGVWCDSAGLRRARMIPANQFFHGGAASKSGVSLTKAVMALPSYGDVVAPGAGLGPVGAVRGIPDPTSLVPCPWNPGHMLALMDMHEKPGEEWEYCPRAALRRALRALDAEFGLELQCGIEHEFVLLKQAAPDGEWAPIDECSYSDVAAINSPVAMCALQDMADALEAIGIHVELIHSESCRGQFEIVTAHPCALEAADKALLARVAISATASKHGLRATFVPKLLPSEAGSGAHVHWSLCGGGRSRMTSPGRGGNLPGGSSDAESFAAGMLLHLPALVAFTAPSPNSFRRVQPGCWAGAFSCWGMMNKEAPINACNDAQGAFSHFEVKCVDASASPHIALAAAVFAGLDGLRKGLRLPPPVQAGPESLTEEERGRAGVVPLPESVAAACAAARAEGAAPLWAGLGVGLVRALLAVREAEEAHFGGWSLEEEVKVLINRY